MLAQAALAAGCTPAPPADATGDANSCAADATAGAPDAAPLPAGASTTQWVRLVVADRSAEADCAKTDAPGVELDAIGLYRGGVLVGVAAVGSARLVGSLTPTCPNNDFAKAAAIEGGVDATGSRGFFALNGGGVEVAFAGCSACTTHIADCDGKGAPVMLTTGDELDVYELDPWYVKYGRATAKTCVCTADAFEVRVRRAAGSDLDAKVLGTFTGTTSRIRVW
ncbi:MAG: hypothetical protein EXR79_10050 [Myxococcales bacterium]|nr:hypothetical protein [Myxococcales bacterium]